MIDDGALFKSWVSFISELLRFLLTGTTCSIYLYSIIFFLPSFLHLCPFYPFQSGLFADVVSI